MTAHTALHAPQANAHANKADDTSPFSLLLESTAPKTNKDVGKDTDKAKAKDAPDDTRAEDTKDTKTDNKADAKTEAKADAPDQAGKSDKADKTGKADDADKPDAKTPDAAQVAAEASVPPAAMAVPPAVTAAATPVPDEADGDIAAVSGAPAAPQKDKTAAPQDATDTDLGDADAAQDIKGAGKSAPHKTAADAKAGKPDVTKPDSAKPDAAKPDAPPPDKTAADTPKPAQAAATNMAVHDITAPQAPQANAPNAPSITQHVQVAPQAQAPVPMPNLPALAIEISAKSQSGAKQFDIRLDPPELGRVEVRLSIDAAGKASAHLSADQPQTLDMLQKDSTSLMRALRDAGLNVSQDGLNFSLRQQSQDGGAHQGAGRGVSRGLALTATTSIEATATSVAFSRPADGRLDISV